MNNMAKPILNIQFTDFYSDFDMHDNPITRILEKRYHVVLSETPDFVFYSCYGCRFLNYPASVRICVISENVIPDFNVCDYAIGFSHIQFDDRYLRHYLGRPLPQPALQYRDGLPDTMAQRQFCNFVYSNADSGEGASLRQAFCTKLMEYKHVDCPGRVMNNMALPAFERRATDWRTQKMAFLAQYKFTIAFENSSTSGYMTEKMYHPLCANSIPIYWGDCHASRSVNSKAFVNVHAFASLNEAVEYIKELDRDDALYLKMLRQPAMADNYTFDQEEQLENFLYAIVEKEPIPFVKDPRGFSLRQIELREQPKKSILARGMRKLKCMLSS